MKDLHSEERNELLFGGGRGTDRPRPEPEPEPKPESEKVCPGDEKTKEQK